MVQKTETVGQSLNVTLEDIYNGGERKIKIYRSRNCKSCKGNGSTNPEKVQTCSKCKGRGIVQGYRQVGPGFVQQFQTILIEEIQFYTDRLIDARYL